MLDIDLLTPYEKVSEWGSNAAKSVKSTVSDAASAASGTAKKLGAAFSGAKDFVASQTNSNAKNITDVPLTRDAYAAANYDLFPIGRPCKFNITVDPFNRFSNYLRSKMSVIDLIPVDYGFDFKRMARIAGFQRDEETGNITTTENGATKDASDDDFQNIMDMFKITYNDGIIKYQELCLYHGLPDYYAGVRLYTTDDTTANDTIQVQYKDSSLQGIANTMSDAGQKMRDVVSSFAGSNMQNIMNDVTKTVKDTSGKLAATLTSNKNIQNIVEGVVAGGLDVLLKGNKLNFPKIWQSTSYNNNLSVNIRLISPYGHPKAIKEFILKPLSYLILLAAPQTVNGVSYGGNLPLTIKAYGMNHIVLGAIASMTLRRGGSDTSYNLYRQPLAIDVSMEFQTLYDSFAVFDPAVWGDKLTYDHNIFKDTSLTDATDLGNFAYEKKGGHHITTSLGTILTSLKPISLGDVSIDPQVYGQFEAPSRDEIPFTSFTPLTGNLGSSISSAVSSIGKFADMVTNAPKLLQQGLANAVYNTAKGTVSNITGSTSKYINNVGGLASKVTNTVMGNLF